MLFLYGREKYKEKQIKIYLKHIMLSVWIEVKSEKHFVLSSTALAGYYY